MLGLNVYRRWRAARKSARAAEIAHVVGLMMGLRVAESSSTPLCGELVFHAPDCPDCGGMTPRACGEQISMKRFLWVGRCKGCSSKKRVLAMRHRAMAKRR